MKRYLLAVILVVLLCAVSCRNKTAVTETSAPQFSNQLTAEEKAGGVMTPEILWKFRRLNSFDLSPDGSTVVCTVTDINMETEARVTNIFKIPSAGGDPVHLTDEGASSPQWFSNGQSVAFVSSGS